MTEAQEEWMQQALALAAKARVHAPPNPWVGCVLVQGKKKIEEGYTQPPGGAHAEIMALQAAGKAARGCDVFITLEPCCHHGRTAPCTEALIEAGVRRVFIPIEDPDPSVSGKGIQRLREAGLEVHLGLGKQKACELLAPYICHRTKKRAYCTAKAAMSIDGRSAATDGSSQWISTEDALKDAHLLRAQAQAIIIGAGTAIADRPRLTVRSQNLAAPKAPLRVLLDPHARVPAKGPLADMRLAPTLVCTSQNTPLSALEKWRACGAEVIAFPGCDRLALLAVLEELAARGIIQVLVEGGPTLLGAFFQERLIDELIVYIGPRLLGETGKPLMKNLVIPSLAKAPRLHLSAVCPLGQTVRLTYNTNPCK